MRLRKTYRLLLMLITLPVFTNAMVYYVSSSGDDTNSGHTPASAWKTIQNVNSIRLVPGDTVLFEAGKEFNGGLWITSEDAGNPQNPVRFGSYGSGTAVINAGNSFGLFAENAAGIEVENLVFTGSGRDANKSQGLIFYNTLGPDNKLEYIRIRNCKVSGFQQAGIFIGSNSANSGYTNVEITNCESFSNGEAGIRTYAPSRIGVINLKITQCVAYDNLGRKEITGTHTGNGILLGNVQNALVEHCVAFNNGYLNGHAGGGPVGIWCYESDNVLIQHNESHHNKAGLEADGGGFDIDGGTTNSVVQYNYSHDNEGAGFLLAQFPNAGPMKNNIIRYNISENDGRKNGYGGITLWGGDPFSDCLIYNNTVFSSGQAIVSGTPSCFRMINTKFKNIQVFNNSFQALKGSRLLEVKGALSKDNIIFSTNNYHADNLEGKIVWSGFHYNPIDWIAATGQETEDGKIVAIIADPGFVKTEGLSFGPGENSVLTDNGREPLIPYGVEPATKDFLNNPVPSGKGYDIGAIENMPAVSVITPEIPGLLCVLPDPASNSVCLKYPLNENLVLPFSLKNTNGKEVARSEIWEGQLLPVKLLP